MSIPPFPSQDLAKLVLGYLAEEQLMTAYDEFLQASPYLDALRNEYDRIFMTSLKNILAEYRAVKICVDTCKPFALRKKIFQCTNLLEVVKFLIANVDLKKIQQEAPVKSSIEKQNVTLTPKPSICELCHSLSLPSCVCKNKPPDAKKPDVNYGATSLQNSVEATPLNELPGNYVTTRKKHVKVQEKDSTIPNSNVSSALNSDSSAKQSFSSHISPEEYLERCENSPVGKSSLSNLSMNSTVKRADPVKSTQNIEEFNNVLKSVVSRNKTLPSSESSTSQRISNAGTFQDFASGVTGVENHSATYNVPDSSTSENLNVRAPIHKDVYNDNSKGPPHQLMLQVSQVNDAIAIHTHKTAKLPKLLPKTLEKQIKIISDIKVDNQMNKKLIPINATSTPLMNMQTIMINGTSAYKHTPNTHTFSKDEIMAMPTLIVVPASGSPQVPTSVHINPIITPNTDVISEENNTSPRVLGPLVIDVPPHTDVIDKPTVDALPDLSEPKPVTSDLIKTVDAKSNSGTTASVPKDNVISLESNTPQILPPMRKSSSTPRRTSHVRVLDFTTPRRILHETINEVPVQATAPEEIVVSGSQSVASNHTTDSETTNTKSELIVVVQEERNNDTGSTKENEAANKPIKQTKKYDWDADLRALVANEKAPNISHRKPKTKASKKKKSIDKTPASKEPGTKKKTRKQSPRVIKTINPNVEESEDELPPNINKTCERVPCKPNIKIICADKSKDLQERKTDSISVKNKSNEQVEDYIETPETERLSLQNVIGAKLNISDFLETPYKQALYDIQMETPKFLGPDIPDIPLSNVKITDIPTPRFLNTPKPVQATPSSYSSRPTDYSSGGSYYKPDDQDYMPIPDLLPCPVTSSKEDISEEKPTEKDSDEKKSRPVRQCARNVSYYKNSGAVKVKDVDDNVDAISSCSDSLSANSSLEFKSKKETIGSKTPRARTQTHKTDTKKKTNSCKKTKSIKDSEVKDKAKSFMKIKPKYTPKKDTPARSRKQMILSPYSKVSSNIQPRKRTTSKDKLVNAASLVVPATTKSRRKSSTPRKLHCTKSFISENCDHNATDNNSIIRVNINIDNSNNNTHDSDTEQLALRWSDEGSQDTISKDSPVKPVENETEDLNKIQEFIVSTGANKSDRINDGALQRDLMKRGFDLETAKIIERDLLDTPMHTESTTKSRTLPISVEIVENKKDDQLEKAAETSSNPYELPIAQEESDEDEIEFTVHENNEDSQNFFVFEHDDTKEITPEPPTKLKDNFTMEICIEDITVRLRATPFSLVLDQDPLTVDEIDYSYKETEQAVDSISGMDRLYTPLKDSYKSKCYEIFDSTLTSIDTPLKAKSPARNICDVSVTELVLQGDSEVKDKSEAKTRKRARSSSNESANSCKRTKPDADLLLKAANIQNIDIETVLTKLHGH